MTSRQLDEEAIFHIARKLANAADRSQYLGQICTGNHSLRARVELLLKAHEQEDEFLKSNPQPAITTDGPAVAERPGTQIGPYKLREQIGEGGFGVVYVAEQEKPVRRKVALKIIKPGMDTKDVIARFEAERQALALMDHPNVARVLDAGATDSGRPYFVMELVHGVPITEFCDKNKLPTRDRLLLFADVCRAVQHAHQKGIIHRDLKPTNIMVTLHDGQPVPKVIDFGVAKAVGQSLTDKTIYTRFAQMIGTPSYMSPEQAEMSGLGIDTRSDIYSLGVLLYELLTGKTPLDAKRLREGGYGEMLRMIRDEEPPRPSLKISTLGDEAATIAQHRHTDPHQLRRSLRGELDWIVMKCLEKDRGRRYETAIGLARDIERYLHDEPVEACPPTLRYRLGKVLRKHYTSVMTGVMVATLMVIATLASAWQSHRAAYAEQRAVIQAQMAQQARDAEVKQRQRAVASEKAARDSEQLAQEQRDAATAAQQAAIQEKNNALAAREDLRHTLYASEMSLIQAAVEGKKYPRAIQLLQQQRPAVGQTDIRGFEWHYWQRRLQQGRLGSVTIPHFASMKDLSAIGSRRFSKGAGRLAALLDRPGDSQSQDALGLVAVFDAASGRELFAPFEPFPDEQGTGSRRLILTMSDNGKWLAAAIQKGLSNTDTRVGHISFRDASTGNEIRRIEIPVNPRAIALTPDGSRVAVASAEVSQPEAWREVGLSVWDTSTGELVQTLPLLRSSVTPVPARVFWSPDGARLIREKVSWETESSSFHALFQCVDMASGEVLWEREFSSPSAPVRPWSFSPDGKLLVVADPRSTAKKPTLQLWDSFTGAILAILDRDAASPIGDATIDFSSDGQLLAVVSAVQEIYVWELPKLPPAPAAAPLHIAAPGLTLQTPGKAIQAIAFSADGRELRSVDAGTSLVTWNTAASEDLRLGPASVGSFQAKISDDAIKAAFIKSGPSPTGVVWDLAADREICRLKTTGEYVGRPAFSSDGRRLALVQYAKTPQENPQIVIHDALTGDLLTTIEVGQAVPSHRRYFVEPVFRPDGRQIAALTHPTWPHGQRIAEPGPSRLVAWDVATGEQSLSVAINSARSADELHYCQGGASLVIGTKAPPAATAEFYDATTGVRQKLVSMPSFADNYFINAPHQMFGAIVDSDFVMWDLTTGQERLRLPGYNDFSYYSISPDGSRLVQGKGSFQANVSEFTFWSLKSGRPLLTFHRPGYLNAMSFSSDGNRLIAAISQSTPGPQKPIQIWDATPLPDEPLAK